MKLKQRTLAILPKYHNQVPEIALAGHCRVFYAPDALREQSKRLEADLAPHWQPHKHLAFPKVRNAYVLQTEGRRILYTKAPVYADGGSARCFIGRDVETGTFYLVRRRSLDAKVAADASTITIGDGELHAREAFAADLAPGLDVAVRSNKRPGVAKIYAVEPLLMASSASLGDFVSRTSAPFAAFLHHFMQDVALQLVDMHCGSTAADKGLGACAHNDVKLDNICVQRVEASSGKPELRFRLIDFELTEEIGLPLERSNVNIRPYELVEGVGECRAASDMFSFGLACLQLILEEAPYQEIAKQDQQARNFSEKHLKLLDAFEAARDAAAFGLPEESTWGPLQRRFFDQWVTVRARVPSYMVGIIEACLRKTIDTSAADARWGAREVLSALAAHEPCSAEIAALNACYGDFQDNKQTLCKISAGLLSEAFYREFGG